jgi:hypothetical protein
MSASRIKQELGACPILDQLLDIVAEYATASYQARLHAAIRHLSHNQTEFSLASTVNDVRRIFIFKVLVNNTIAVIERTNWTYLYLTWDELRDRLADKTIMFSMAYFPDDFPVTLEDQVLSLIDLAVVEVDLADNPSPTMGPITYPTGRRLGPNLKLT